MQVSACNPPGRANAPNGVARIDRITYLHQLLAKMKIGAQQPATVIEIDDISSKKERLHKRHDATGRGDHRVPLQSLQIQAHVAARKLSVEDAAISKATGHATRPRHHDVLSPEAGRPMCVSCHPRRHCAIASKPDLVSGVRC